MEDSADLSRDVLQQVKQKWDAEDREVEARYVQLATQREEEARAAVERLQVQLATDLQALALRKQDELEELRARRHELAQGLLLPAPSKPKATSAWSFW